MDLLERESLIAQLVAFSKDAALGRGRMVAVGGEAGIGKSALVTRFVEECVDMDVHIGRCDPLTTPRPMGALRDIAEPGGRLAEALDGERAPHEICAIFLRQLRESSPGSIVVVEDVHWADEATLDLLRYVARRIADVPALVIMTFRDDETGPEHPTRVMLGDVASLPAVVRLQVPRLSAQAVTQIAAHHGLDGAELLLRTDGNPFFVTEVLAGGPVTIPDTVRDAVLARAARLDPVARRLLDLISILPSTAERWLLIQLTGADLRGLDACLAAGMLIEQTRTAVRFRHELARMSIELSLPVARRTELHRRLVEVLRTTRVSVDPAWIVHHAQAAGDDATVLEIGPVAARRAAAAGAHREAAAHYAAILLRAEAMEPAQRAEILERRSYECYLTNDLIAAASAQEQARACWAAVGDQVRIGDSLRWLSRLYWFLARRDEADAAGASAVEVLERQEPGRELAMAFSNQAQLAMLAGRNSDAAAWGGRALELAERLGAIDIVVHALNNIGTAMGQTGDPAGVSMVDRSLVIALENELDEHAARAYTNLLCMTVELRDLPAARRYADDGDRYCAERDLDTWRLYMAGWRARLELDSGHWAAAAAVAVAVVTRRDAGPLNRINALTVLGLVRARLGEPGVGEVLDEALDLARRTGEAVRVANVVAARAEAAWLAGSADPPPELTELLSVAEIAELPMSRAELLPWARRFTITDEAGAPPPTSYDDALAAIDGSDVERIRRAAETLRALGARPALNRASAALRALGAPAVRPARSSTAANPGGLTSRELEVLLLVRDGLSDSAIAQRLVLSGRTVGHHVSAVLRKLAVAHRADAGAAFDRLDIPPTLDDSERRNSSPK